MERDEILAYAAEVARTQPGGTLATTHAEDGTPYVTYVLGHLTADGRVLFGSQLTQQHSRNIAATAEVSFLFDNRSAIFEDWTLFDRVVIEGSATIVEKDSAAYEPLIAELAAKTPMGAFFTRHGELFCISPRRLILNRGLEGIRHVASFDS
jgi:hypothetical protein